MKLTFLAFEFCIGYLAGIAAGILTAKFILGY